MKKLWVIGTLSLAFAGCAHTRSALTKDDKGPPKEPISVGSVPSVHDTINRGTGGPAVARTTMKDPNSPQWDGRVGYPGGDASISGGSAVAPRPAAAMAAAPVSGASALSAPANQSAIAASPGFGAAAEQPMPGGAPGAAPAMGAPLSLEASAPAVPGSSPTRPTMISPTPIVGAAPAAVEPAATASTGATANAGLTHAESIDAPPISQLPASSPPTDLAVSPSAGAETLSPAPAPVSSKAAQRKADPLLGPDPDVMPAMPDLDTVKPAAAAAAVKPSSTKPPTARDQANKPAGAADLAPAAAAKPTPASTPTPARDAPPLDPSASSSAAPLEFTPTPMPTPTPTPLPTTAPTTPAASDLPDLPELPPLPDPGSSASRSTTTVHSVELTSASSLPASAGKLEAADVIEQAPTKGPALADSEPKSRASAVAPAGATLRISPPRDSQVARAAVEFSGDVEPAPRNLGKQAGKPVARVGDEIITFHDLVLATKEAIARYGSPAETGFNSSEQLERRRQIDTIAKYTLDSLIERSILVQEAKHAIKDNKQLDKMMEIADRVWKEEQLPVLERQNQVDNEHVLKEKLAERGRSLDVLKSNFKQDFLAQGFLQDRLKDKLRIELPEELKYYNDHMHDRDFQRPAQITWRELVVETAKYPDKAAARRKIESLARALRQGADFAKLAKAESDGPAIVRDQGGLMQTSPGSYAVKSVNDALGSLAIGATSGVLEGPTSFHIVRVEGRRGAGPASFEEVRAQIRPKLAEEKFKKERSAFVKKLRDRTLVSTIFDPPPAALTATNK